MISFGANEQSYNYFLIFKEAEQSNAYDKFQTKRSPLFFQYFVYLLLCTYALDISISSVKNFPSIMSYAILVLLIVSQVLPGALMLGLKTWALFNNTNYRLVDQYSPILESVWVLGSCFCHSVIIYMKVSNGKCEFDSNDRSFSVEWATRGCDNEMSLHKLPENMTLFALFSPVIYALVAKAARWVYVLSSWIGTCKI